MTVAKTYPTITNFSIASKIIGDPPFTITNPSSNSSGSFTYTSSNSSVATISGNTVTILTGGSTVITATQASTVNYIQGTITSNLIVMDIYNHEFYSYSATNSNILNYQIYDNSGSLISNTDISFGDMSIPDVLAFLDESGNNPYTIGIVDSSANKVRMDLAYCDVFTTFMNNTVKNNLITNVNSTYKEPHTIADSIFNLTVSGELIVCKTTGNVEVSSINLSANLLYLFDQSDPSNLGKEFKFSSTQYSLTEITSGIFKYGVPGYLNAYTIILPTSNITAYIYKI